MAHSPPSILTIPTLCFSVPFAAATSSCGVIACTMSAATMSFAACTTMRTNVRSISNSNSRFLGLMLFRRERRCFTAHRPPRGNRPTAPRTRVRRAGKTPRCRSGCAGSPRACRRGCCGRQRWSSPSMPTG